MQMAGAKIEGEGTLGASLQSIYHLPVIFVFLIEKHIIVHVWFKLETESFRRRLIAARK